MAFGNPKKIIYEALEGKYAVAAFNVNSLDSIIATIEGAEKENMPIFLQVHQMCEDYVEDVDTYVKALKVYIEASKIDIVLHHDHCNTYEEIELAVKRGFQSVMFDGSKLSFEENVKETKKVVDLCHANGVFVEAELGSIPGGEDVVFSGNNVFTEPNQVPEFIERTGCDMLAVSVGTAHGGVRWDGHLPFYFDKLEKIVASMDNYPFVLHGGASMPVRLIEDVNSQGGQVDEQMHICSEGDIAKSCAMGIAKVNMDVDNWLAFTAAVRKSLNDIPEVYETMTHLKAGRRAWEQEVRHKIVNLKKYAK